MNKPRRRVAAAVGAAVLAAATGTVVSLTVGSPAGAVPQCSPTPDFTSSIVEPLQGPAAAPTDDGGVAYATIGGDRKVYTYDTDISDPTTLLVGQLSCLGGGALDTPAVVDYGTGRAFFVTAPNQRIYQNYVTDEGVATGWSVVPGALAGSAPAASVDPDGVVQLFVRGTNGKLYLGTHDPAGAPAAWSAFRNLGGSMLGMPGVATSGGLTVVAVRAPNNYVYTLTGASGNWPTYWIKLNGTTVTNPTVASGFQTGRLDVFVSGATGGLYQATAITPAGSPYTTFGAFRKVDDTIPGGTRVAAAGQSGNMAVYATVPLGNGETITGINTYVPGFSWSGFSEAPYTCELCTPEASPTTTSAGKKLRPVERTPLR